MGWRRIEAKPRWTWNREYWSRRLKMPIPWGRVGKWFTHKHEHAAKTRLEKKFKHDPSSYDNT